MSHVDITESDTEPGNPLETALPDSQRHNLDAVVADELLRERIRALSSERPAPTKFEQLKKFSHNPLLSVAVATILGALLTFYLTGKLQDLSTRRSFSDELNKARIQKIGEVWEQIDRNEVILDQLLGSVSNQPSGSQKETFDKINKIVDEDITVINKGRFWLGETAYNQLKDYLDITGRYVSDMLLGPPGIDLSETLKKREKAKQDVLKVRNMFLRGESEL